MLMRGWSEPRAENHLNCQDLSDLFRSVAPRCIQRPALDRFFGGTQLRRPSYRARGALRSRALLSSLTATYSPFHQRAAASAVSSGRVLNAMNVQGAARCTALITASNSSKLFGGRRTPAPITTPS
jgi:hypothetical protein